MKRNLHKATGGVWLQALIVVWNESNHASSFILLTQYQLFPLLGSVCVRQHRWVVGAGSFF